MLTPIVVENVPGSMARCECGNMMDARRCLPRLLPTTHGRCSDCNVLPRKEALAIERARRVAAFGEGRC